VHAKEFCYVAVLFGSFVGREVIARSVKEKGKPKGLFASGNLK
jgi:hypothetical protein